MRWPFVTRARYDEIVHQLAAEIREAERAREAAELRERQLDRRHALELADRDTRLNREAGRVDVLTRFLMRMKAQGAVLLPESSAQATRTPGQPRPMTPVEQAIDDNPRARGNPALRRRLNSFVEAERKKGTQEGEIVERLRTWADPTHDDDEEEGAFD